MSDVPHDLSKLLGGRYCRALIALITPGTPDTPPPAANLVDGFAQTGAGAVVSPYRNAGSIGDTVNYEREIESEGYRIRERTSEVLEDITEVNRTVEFDLNEVTPENLQMFEAAGTITTVAAAAGKGAQKWVKAGDIEELPEYRLMFVFRRKKTQSAMVEPGGATRGSYVALVVHRAKLQADGSEIEAETDELVSIPMAMRLVPESTLAGPVSSHAWVEEQAGTIAAA